MSLTTADLRAIKDRLDATTPGPWESFVEGRDPPGRGYDSFIRTAGEDLYVVGATTADQDFIAHARQDIQALLDELERARGDKPT